MPRTEDEFAEFETDETAFDAMLRDSEPAELASWRVTLTAGPGLPVTIGDPTSTAAGAAVVQSRARRLPAIRHEEPAGRMAS